jgi:hypothetical protein
MNRYRSAALALVTCAASLSLAACSAGITAAAPTASSPAASSSHSAASRPASGSSSPGSTVSAGSISFPIPPGAKVIENITSSKQTAIILGSVKPAEVSRFYTSVLPKDGFKITNNTLASENNGSGAAIDFRGHGYKGTIGAVSNLSSPGVSIGDGVNSSNFTGITLTRQ